MELIWSDDSHRLATPRLTGPASACGWSRSRAAAGLGLTMAAALVVGCGSDSNVPTAPPPPLLQAATVAVNGGDTQTATVGTPVPTPPSVRVSAVDGSPLPGVTVHFDVIAGGGRLIGSPAVSDSAGVAALERWTLGTAAGRNELRATVAAATAVRIEAIATPGAVEELAALRGDAQTAPAGSAVSVNPAVAVRDAYANPVPGITVVFTVEHGDGRITGPTAVSDSSGVATVGGWTLGATPGANSLTAAVAGDQMSVNTVTFSATGTGGGTGPGYDIVLRYNAGSIPTTAQRQAFVAAAERWEEVLIGDLPDVAIDRPTGTCSSTSPIDETVDDLVIFVTLEPIDGPGGLLGSAGPCLIRSGSNLPLAGSIRFDTADLAGVESSGLLYEVVLHEMGHVIGVGSLWNLFGFLADPSQSGGLDPHFTGPQALAAFDGMGGSVYPSAKVPVEDTGGSGTADAHWRETVFDREVMTGWIDAGVNPLSSITVSSLADHGYATDPASADPLSLSISPSIVPRPGERPRALLLVDDVAHGPIEVVNTRGRTERILPN